MKKIIILCLLLSSCSKMLDEKPNSTLTPDFYKSVQGVNAALDASYAGTRTLWGCEDYFSLATVATDEFMKGNDGNSNMFLYAPTYQTNDGKVQALWKNCYTYINTCNAVIDFAPEVAGIPADTKKRFIAEAKFLRANYNFVLVQFWGDVTLLDKFQDKAITSATRNPQAEVFEAIIKDLKEAIPDLQPAPTTKGLDPGRASAAAAKHVLAKVYLARAGGKSKVATDYRDAYNTAVDLINTAPGLGLGLLPDFGNIFAEGNEANIEVLWSVQHTSSLAYNGSPAQDNRTPDNMLVHLFSPLYEKVDGMARNIHDGRPYIRTIPTLWLIDTVFKERVNDTRFDKSFQTVWYSNNAASIPKWPATLPPGAPANAVPGGPKFKLGDTAIYMPQGNRTAAQIAAAYYTLIPSRLYNPRLSPALTKYVDTKRSDMNAPSIRPVIAYRLAETYLVAAEAALMDGRPGDAVPYLNAVRERAAFPTGNKAAMTITAADVNLDFILDERSRELAGENTRWLDLIRTGQLQKRLLLHTPDSRANFIAPKHLLRPIPQGQIDAVTTGPKYPQNEGWF
ncbi:RagB/SusD family nutrient uptake outer membrane protein [Chitinophaga sp. SYP-B3965]|uniref:RagB/SusD family nutrient uptake outer membrane protein n=1 Tax=Chitinophaga sp. SYP-B3965 TaxID=2663120 RepID=UPI00129A00C3|nr:RagB/SusD family nutrient uptake outer membrane protein [Chitinophaga sp. SYP-B3965]MRG48941.1 RagB/SusD family nutrient uptake outer membrane protein [Chitinophaga sp. SYP-B3965]